MKVKIETNGKVKIYKDVDSVVTKPKYKRGKIERLKYKLVFKKKSKIIVLTLDDFDCISII